MRENDRYGNDRSRFYCIQSNYVATCFICRHSHHQGSPPLWTKTPLCKLSVLCTHRFTLCSHQHRTSSDAPCVDGDTVNLCVHDKTEGQLTTAMIWFTEVAFPDDDDGSCWNMLEYGLPVYKSFESYMYILFVQFLNNNFSMHICLSGPLCMLPHPCILGLLIVWLRLCVEAKNGSSISECSKETELWCDDCSDLSAQHGLHKDWTWSRWWSALTILQWNPAGWYQARRATSVNKFPTSWGCQWCELSVCLLLMACGSCQCVCC